MRLLINGSVVASGVALGPPSYSPSIPIGIGTAFLDDGTTNYPAFIGYARQVRFWQSARTVSQVRNEMFELLPNDRTGLVAVWPLDESGGALAKDISGAGRNLSAKSVVSAMNTVLESGPFFDVSTNEINDGSLPMPAEAMLIDFDSDGDLDLVIAQRAAPTYPETRTRLRAFRNSPGGFVDATDDVIGNVTMVHPRDYYVGDFNGDKRDDLLIVGHGTDTRPFPGEQSKLLIQQPNGRLLDETSTRLPQRSYFTHGVAVADIDGDGDLDIYMCNTNLAPDGPRFYINNGSGVFSDSTDRLPANIASGNPPFTSCLLADINGDGHPDLLLGAGGGSVNELLINNGRGYFQRDPRFVLPRKLFEATSTTVAIRRADLNGDGLFDLLLATTGGSIEMPHGKVYGYQTPGLQVLLNQGSGTFLDATTSAGFKWTDGDRWVVWPHVVDLNGDGRTDIVAAMAGSPHRIFINQGSGVFTDATAAAGSFNQFNVVQAADINRDKIGDLIGIRPKNTSTSIVSMRGTRRIEYRLFEDQSELASRLSNLSLLTNISSGDPLFTLGAVIGGAGTRGRMPMLIRGAGRSLEPLGVSGSLPDPKLVVFSGDRRVSGNDNWSGSSELTKLFSQVGAFSYTSASSLDAALAITPDIPNPPYSLTVQVSGEDGKAGAVIAELYDAISSADLSSLSPRLINVSVLKYIGAGEIITVGFVIQGQVPKQVLVRAVGPTLGAKPFEVSGAMADPKMELFQAQSVIASNDDWEGSVALNSAFRAVGAFALDSASKDAALRAYLKPGNYTVQVRGSGTSSGMALIEVYEVP